MPNTTSRAQQEPHKASSMEDMEQPQPSSPDVACGTSRLPVYGCEVVGRRIKLQRTVPSASGTPGKSQWQPATITGFNPDDDTHEITVTAASSEQHTQWLQLPRHKFQWQDAPPTDAAPNPSWEASPKEEDAVGRSIKVFWPGMCRWYSGVVSSYDAHKGMHVVDYQAGDTYEHDLKHEAVQWPEARSSSPQDTSAPTQRTSNVSASSAFAAPGATPVNRGADSGQPQAQPAVHIQTARVKRPRPACSASHPVSQLNLPSLSSRKLQSQPEHSPAALACTQLQTASRRASWAPSAAGISSSVEKQRQLTMAAMLSPPSAGRPVALPSYCPSAAILLLGVRLSVTGSLVRSGKVVDVQLTAGRHKVRFDDGACEWMSLSSTSWQWQTPRSGSAGLNAAMTAALRKLGSANLMTHQIGQYPAQGPPIPVLGKTPKSAEAAVGHKVWIWCRGDARWHAAQVMALSASGSGRHHVLYTDGSDEWVELNQEVVAWEPAGPATGMQHVLVGMPKGTRAPVGQAAVGWRIAVYWPQDQTLYEGLVTGYHASTWEHEVKYDDGELEVIHLEEELVVWRCRAAPGQARQLGNNSAHKSEAAPRKTPGGVVKRAKVGSDWEASPEEGGRPAASSQSPAASVIGEVAAVQAAPGVQQDVVMQWGGDASAAVRALEACKPFVGAGQVHGLPHVQSVV